MDLVLAGGVSAVVFAYLVYRYWKKRSARARKPTKDDIYPMW